MFDFIGIVSVEVRARNTKQKKKILTRGDLDQPFHIRKPSN